VSCIELEFQTELKLYSSFREDKRRNEIEELISQGKIPHDQELEKHPEISMEGRGCKKIFWYFPSTTIHLPAYLPGLMGKVAGSVNVGAMYSARVYEINILCRTSNLRKKCETPLSSLAVQKTKYH